jgi:16S rRNA (cytidine1402-2'-O)-methyltransferase
MGTRGTLYLIPVPLAESVRGFDTELSKLVGCISDWIVETPKVARAQLRVLNPDIELGSLQMDSWSKHGGNDATALLQACVEGRDMGLISDAGAPGMADPGAEVVAKAHEMGITVVPWPGPSSLLLGLMASGLNGQQFSFHGYLSHDTAKRKSLIVRMDREAAAGSSHWFIETPYRNAKLFAELIQALSPSTRLFIGVNLSAPDEWNACRTVAQWRSLGIPRAVEAKSPAIWGIGR